MTDFFYLSTFKKLDLWLTCLLSYHDGCGFGFRQRKAAPNRQSHREHVRTSQQIVQDILRLSDRILRDEIAEQKERDPSIMIDDEADARDMIRFFGKRSKELRGLIEFWEFLEHYRVLAMGIVRLPNVSRMEFNALSHFLLGEIEKFRASETYSVLEHSSANSQFRYLLDREIVNSLEMPGIQERIKVILTEFFHILQLIKYIQSEMKVRFQIHKLLVLFSYCHESYQAFIKLLEDSRQYLDRYQPDIVEMIYSTTFALKMEMRKVFRDRLDTIESKTPVNKAYSEMEDALGLLHNAFRECFINLVLLLKRDFDEQRIFMDLGKRHQETLALLQDLSRMRILAAKARKSPDDRLHYRSVLGELKRFDQTSKRLLFFKDWQDIEDFEKELSECDHTERPFALHRFEIFLTTLISEVGKRTVLSKFQARPSEASA